MAQYSPRIWALLGARAGDNHQVLALAEALGLPFETKQLEFNILRRLGPRLLGRSLISLKRPSRTLIDGQPPPDLTISVGHRSVPLVQALRHRSGARTRSVHIGFPRIDPSNFDLVVTTPQYPVPHRRNVVRLPFALAGVSGTEPNLGDKSFLVDLPRPLRLLIVGGPNIYWKIEPPILFRTLQAMLDEAQEDGGSVLVTTSPRTPPKLKSKISDVLKDADVPTLLAEPKRSPTYASLLAAADSIRVTADSVAMVSDTISTGKPMALVAVTPNLLGAIVMATMDRLRPGRPLFPQDLRSFWRAIADLGVGEHLARPRLSRGEQMRDIAQRVRAVLLQ